jgi:hypothetical protein
MDNATDAAKPIAAATHMTTARPRRNDTIATASHPAVRSGRNRKDAPRIDMTSRFRCSMPANTKFPKAKVDPIDSIGITRNPD